MSDSWTIAREASGRSLAEFEVERESATLGVKILGELRIAVAAMSNRRCLRVWSGPAGVGYVGPRVLGET